MSTDLTGQRLGHYLVESVLGRGGMSTVYRAVDERLDRPVALKVISENLSADAEFRERFVEEARAASAIDHVNVVPLYDFGEAGRWLYIAMRLVDGTDLAREVARANSEGKDASDGTGGMATRRVLDLLGQVGEALDMLHERGLVHLDVKPANVLITRNESIGREHVYLADFGLTRRGASGHRTASGDFLGSPTYASPEHLRGDPVAPASDLYSLTCVLFTCLAGRAPFTGTVKEVVSGHLRGQVPSLSARTGLPSAIDRVIARGMATDPTLRYPDSGELLGSARRALSDFSDEPIGRTTAPVGGAGTAVAPAAVADHRDSDDQGVTLGGYVDDDRTAAGTDDDADRIAAEPTGGPGDLGSAGAGDSGAAGGVAGGAAGGGTDAGEPIPPTVPGFGMDPGPASGTGADEADAHPVIGRSVNDDPPPRGHQEFGDQQPGQPQFGQPQPGQQQFGQPQFGQSQPGQQQPGQPQPGQQQSGHQQFGDQPPGQQQFGHQQFGRQPGGQGPGSSGPDGAGPGGAGQSGGAGPGGGGPGGGGPGGGGGSGVIPGDGQDGGTGPGPRHRATGARPTWPWLALGAVLLIAAIVVLIIGLTSSDDPAPESPPAGPGGQTSVSTPASSASEPEPTGQPSEPTGQTTPSDSAEPSGSAPGGGSGAGLPTLLNPSQITELTSLSAPVLTRSR